MPKDHPKIAKAESLIERLIAPPLIFPGEDPQSFEALRQAFLLDLAPRSPYEKVLAENLAILEWEASRHRTMRDELIRSRARDLAIGLFETGRVQPPHRPSEENTALGFALMASRPFDLAVEAMARLEELNISSAEILARAYSHMSSQVEVHERMTAELERRRQRLKEEYDRLKALRRPPIEEAELIE